MCAHPAVRCFVPRLFVTPNTKWTLHALTLCYVIYAILMEACTRSALAVIFLNTLDPQLVESMNKNV